MKFLETHFDEYIQSVDKQNLHPSFEKIYKQYSDQYQIFFANGGNQTNSSIPELSICKQYGIGLIDGLGEKIQSSSWILKKRK